MTKQSLFQLLADNQIETLFQELKGSNSKYLNDLVLLESQWSDLRARERNGTISSEQSNLEVARIRKNLLELIERSFSTQAAIAMPFRKASGSGNRTWILLAAITVVVIAILFFLFPSSPDVSSSVDLKRESKSQSTSPTSSKDNQKGNGSASRMLEVPANNMTFNKGRIGDITYKFLSAELSEQNTEHWLLRLKIRGIKPAYGFLVGSNQMHISYGDFEKAPVSNSFAYINPGETADGVLEFEVPKEFQEAKLLIYNYADEPPLASIPFTW